MLALKKSHHADTDLYHAQAIRWIEEYGVVKGLGNWHNRLAYNSSYMCLQALFSGAFLLNQSTHTVNGYIAFGMFAYVLYSFLFQEESKLNCSFWFRLAMIMLLLIKPVIVIISGCLLYPYTTIDLFAFGIPCIVLGRLPDMCPNLLLRIGRWCVWCGRRI